MDVCRYKVIKEGALLQYLAIVWLISHLSFDDVFRIHSNTLVMNAVTDDLYSGMLSLPSV